MTDAVENKKGCGSPIGSLTKHMLPSDYRGNEINNNNNTLKNTQPPKKSKSNQSKSGDQQNWGHCSKQGCL